jgi:mono/diheme cytochrome c family protein
MRRWIWVVLTTAVATLVLVSSAATAVLLRGGISARPEPSALEAAIAQRARALAIPASARAARNPLPASGQALEAARAHFADHCASCHGNDGRGQTAMGRALYPRPPDLTAASTQGLSDGELFYVIENGVRFTGMPGFGAAGRPEESWKLVHFIRHLPTQTKDEAVEMEKLNPRTAAEWRELQADDDFLDGAEVAPAGHPAHMH